MGLVILGNTLLGVFVGVIFILDGWRSSETPNTPLHQSPRIRGLIYVLGGGVIPGVQILATGDTNSLLIYTSALVVAALLGLLLLSVYAFVLSRDRLRDFMPGASRGYLRTEAFHRALILLQDGPAAFRMRSDADLTQRIISQRDRSISFLCGSFDGLVKSVYDRHQGVERFAVVAGRSLDFCLKRCLEQSDELTMFRASLYYLDRTDTKRPTLRFIAGAGPEHDPHSEKPLGYDTSIAGWAIKNPGHLCHWPLPSGPTVGEQPPFEARESRTRYRSVVAYAPRPRVPKAAPTSGVEFVISFDCKDLGLSTFGEYIEKIMNALSVLIGDALYSMEVTHESLGLWSHRAA